MSVPQSKDVGHGQEKAIANPAELLLSLGHPLEVAEQVREADLALIQIDEGIASVPIADEDADGLLADQFLGHIRSARVANHEGDG
jgi:hypothetical protein